MPPRATLRRLWSVVVEEEVVAVKVVVALRLVRRRGCMRTRREGISWGSWSR
jgi:hypothetical protein